MDAKELKQMIDQKEETLKQLKLEREALEKELLEKRQAFNRMQKTVHRVENVPKRIKKTVRLLGGIVLRRRDPRHLYSPSFKQKHAENQLKPYRKYLYNYGLVDTVLQDLNKKYRNPINSFERLAVAKELLIWHANRQTKEDAWIALEYLKELAKGETSHTELQKLAIMEAELLCLCGQNEAAKTILDRAAALRKNPNLELAQANLVPFADEKLKYINQVMKAYDLEAIQLKGTNSNLYDQLSVGPINESIDEGPLVSVIVPVFNAEKGLSTAIDSLLLQTWKNIEIIVVNDQSTDQTSKVIENYVSRHSQIKSFDTPTNSGPYVARNIGLEHAKGEFVTIHDADDWSHPRKIERQVTHLIENPQVIANTSEHARMTEDLNFYRRGQFGKYIFPNMSSILFRKQPVIDEIGFWDEVRFAADGEFKQRLLLAFGKDAFVDLKSGPLSLPRQSAQSLTTSSAFGYDGHFKGVRKEYVESFKWHHQMTGTLYYPKQPEERLFPVPYPMLPDRKKLNWQRRQLDVIVAADFRIENEALLREIEVFENMGKTVGLMQLSIYDLTIPDKVHESFRKSINGESIQMLNYGERLECEFLLVDGISCLQDGQTYIPDVEAKQLKLIVRNESSLDSRKFGPIRIASHRLLAYFNKKGVWHATNQTMIDKLKSKYQRETKHVVLSTRLWPSVQKSEQAFRTFAQALFLPN